MVSDALGQYMGEPFGNLYKDLLKIDKLDKLVKLVKLDNLISNNISNFTNLTSIPVPEIYINRAYDIIKPCFEYVSKLVDYVDVFQPYAKVKKVIDKHPEIQHSRLMQLTHLPPKQIFQATKMLEDEEYIEIEIIKTPKKKPKNIYRKVV